MGEQIGIRSEQGKGSSFWFTAQFKKQAPEVTKQPLPLLTLDNLRVLIVDDNATNRKILSHQLAAWGLHHQEASSGRRALEVLRGAVAEGAAYDLAVLDLMMPEMDGFELARAIKSDPALAGVHLVLLTSFGQRGQSLWARGIGIESGRAHG